MLEKNKKIKKWGIKNYQMISNGLVKIGMTKEMCLEAWGYPNSVNKTITQYNINEQWVYDDFNYLYFNGNILTAIQTNQ